MHILNRYYDKIFVINLDRRIDRWNDCLSFFSEQGIEVTRWPAIEHKEGWRGLVQTNIDILEHAESEGYKSILILEDDIEWNPDTFSTQFTTCVSELPDDWDMFYFSGTHQYWPVDWSPHVSRMVWTYTTHAVAIHKHMYRTLLYVLKRSARPLDVEWGEIQPFFKTFCAMPHIAWQRDGFSDIEHKTITYGHLK